MLAAIHVNHQAFDPAPIWRCRSRPSTCPGAHAQPDGQSSSEAAFDGISPHASCCSLRAPQPYPACRTNCRSTAIRLVLDQVSSIDEQAPQCTSFCRRRTASFRSTRPSALAHRQSRKPQECAARRGFVFGMAPVTQSDLVSFAQCEPWKAFDK